MQRFTEEHRAAARFFGRVGLSSEGETSAGSDSWREFKTEQEWQQSGDPDTLGDAAFVWLREGKLVAANFTIQSGSGDWVLYANYCFRPDGTVALLQSTLKTFYGQMSAVRRSFYNQKGKLLRSSTEYFDLRTGKPKRPGQDFIDERLPQFRTVNELPFWEKIR